MVEELGTFRKVDPVVVEADPFWSVVRRRHRDVDIVLLLPPDGPEEVPEELSGPDTVRAAVDAVLIAWQLLGALVVATGVPGAGAPPSVRRDLRDGAHALVLQKAVRGLGEDGGTDLLREIALGLGRSGWRLRPNARDGHPLLEVTDGRTHVRAEAGVGAAVLTVSSVALAAADDDRALVAAQVRQAVASWR